jgi:energy-coupling factor transporter ATP-binding protein EcfA2
MYITSITINNFRAFHNQETISIPKGHNLLVYGENGSGKSSFFRAVHDFFNSSRTVIPFEKNSFKTNDEGFVEVNFTAANEGAIPTPYIFHSVLANTNTNIAPHIQQAFKAGGFLTYVQLLKTYLIESKGENPNLFELLVNNILADHIIPYDNATPLNKEWKRVSRLRTMNRTWSEYRNAVREGNTSLDPFNDSLGAILTELQTHLTYLLNTYFNHEINVTITGLRVNEISHKKLGNKDVRFEVTYTNHRITDGYQYYLNEARLSALAICTYLASLRINQPNIPYKILFLDDVFIGLDTSNRIPLINIINNEFQDYQVFITTYDRNWFDIAKEHINNAQWSLMEMYYDRIVQDNPNSTQTVLRDEPVIINPSPTYITRAKEYFKAKDYAAASNYLRKEIERLIKSKLPLEYRTTPSENWGTNDITKLDTLIQKLIEYYKDCDEPLALNLSNAISLYRKIILNPQSHDDNKSPTYRIEIEKAFQLISDFESIQLIRKKELLPVGSVLSYINPARQYSVVIKLQENQLLYEVGGVKKLSKCNIHITTWSFQGVEYSNCNPRNNQRASDAIIERHCNEDYSLQGIYDLIVHSIGIGATTDLLSEFSIGTETLRIKHDNIQFV